MVRRSAEKIQHIGMILPTIVKRAARRHATLSLVQRRWGRLVGVELAKHTKPVTLRRGQLVVQVDQPGVSFVLSYERARLVERLRHATKGTVNDVVIRPGDV